MSTLRVSQSMVAISSSDNVFFRSLMMSDTEPAPQYSITIWNQQTILCSHILTPLKDLVQVAEYTNIKY